MRISSSLFQSQVSGVLKAFPKTQKSVKEVFSKTLLSVASEDSTKLPYLILDREMIEKIKSSPSFQRMFNPPL